MPHPTDIHVGQKLREARRLQCISQEKLASMIGVSFQQVQKYENGSNRIGASRLWDISTNLKIPVSFFFEGMENSPAEGQLSRQTVRLAHQLESISNQKVRNRILQLISACSEIPA